MGDDYYVTVCGECNRACCWHGEFQCELAATAGTEEVLASDLAAVGLEHRDHYTRERLVEVCGSVEADRQDVLL